MSLPRTVSEIDGDFMRKLQQQKIPTRVFCTPAYPSNWASAQGTQDKPEWWGYQEVQKDRFSRLDTIPACDGQTDIFRRQIPR